MSSNDDTSVEIFESKIREYDAEYSALKGRVEIVKGEIRRERERLRLAAITGDPRMAADQADAGIQWMRGLGEILEQNCKGPAAEQTNQQRT